MQLAFFISLFTAVILGIQPTTSIRIPDCPTKGFAFSIKNYGHVSESDINITHIRSGQGGWCDIALKAALKAVDIKKQIANTLNGQSQYNFSSLPPGTVVDESKKQQIPNKVVTIILDDWPIYAGTPFDPIYISGTVRLDLSKGEAWIAPAKMQEHLALL